MSNNANNLTAFEQVLACKIPKEAAEKFVNLLNSLPQTPNELFLQSVDELTNEILQESVSVLLSKKFCDELVSFIGGLTNNHLAVAAFQLIMPKIQSRSIAFETQMADLRLHLSKKLEAMGNIREAANVLSEIPLDSGQRTYPAVFKMDIYLRMAEYHLRLHDISDAEAFINRASLLLPECHDEKLSMRHKAAYALLLDHKRKFLEAGQRYAELSIRFSWMPEAERLTFLERALAASLLSSAGQQRGRLLATLYKDKRCQSFEAYPILEKMYMGRLIDRSSLHGLESLFQTYYPHLFPSNTSEAQGITNGHSILRLLDSAVVEHNLVAASLIYNNITLDNLGKLLKVSSKEAESIASQMISEGRLSGQIDQIDQVIHFKVSSDGQDPVLDAWSSKIRSLCTTVNDIAADIEASHPTWFQTMLANRMVDDIA